MQAHNNDSNFFSAQVNAWTDLEQLNSWLKNVWYPIAQSIEGPKLLLVDSYPLYIAIQDKFSKYNTIGKFIPARMSWLAQSLDGLYHKVYNDDARHLFIQNQSRAIGKSSIFCLI